MRFHSWIGDNNYGADGRLTNNWDPNAEYSDGEFVNVHFRIKTDSFLRGCTASFDEEADRMAFGEDLCRTFSDEWRPDGSAIQSCSEIRRGPEGCHEYLYLHPMDFSGWIKKTSVGEIVRQLEESEHPTFSLEGVDLYGETRIMSDAELRLSLQERYDSLVLWLFASAKTKRRNAMYYRSQVIERAVRHFDVRRANRRDRLGKVVDNVNSFDPVALAFVGEVVDSLIEKRWLIQTESNGMLFVRAANKTEQRARRLDEVNMMVKAVTA